MRKFTALLLVFVIILAGFFFTPKKIYAYTLIAAGASGGPVGIAIAAAITVFLTLFKDKLKCAFGGETGIGKIIGDGSKSKNFSSLEKNGINDFLNNVNKNENFGGPILKAMECKCGGDSVLKDFSGKQTIFVIGSPRPAVAGPTASSKIYDYKSLKENNWVLGKITNKKVCKNPVAYGIKEVGTSR